MTRVFRGTLSSDFIRQRAVSTCPADPAEGRVDRVRVAAQSLSLTH